jgi:acyl-CoA thioesterase II
MPTRKTKAPAKDKSGDQPGRANKALKQLLEILDLEPLEKNLFRGQSPQQGWQRVFGGQVIGQALQAATRTVEDRYVHSLHSYFLLPGDPAAPIIYEVDRLRDGGSFTTRRIIAIQHGRAIFAMTASFQKMEPGLEHQVAMPDLPQPEDLPNEQELQAKFIDSLPDNIRTYWSMDRPIEMRPVDSTRFFATVPPETRRDPRAPRGMPVQHVWMRATGRLPDDLPLHQCVLAFASDFTLLDTALVAHGRRTFDPDLQMASLDHAVWFHRPFRADEWLLYVQDSPSTSGARGLCRGLVYTRSGVLVASVAQEGLMRPRKDA